jgi:hypothetical protein
MKRRVLEERLRMGVEGVDFILCQVPGCSAPVRQLSPHLRAHRGSDGLPLSVIEYQTRYPGAPTVCAGTLEKYRANIVTSLPEDKRNQGLDQIRAGNFTPQPTSPEVRKMERAIGTHTATRAVAQAQDIFMTVGLITLGDASLGSGISRRTLYSAAQEGRLPAVTIYVDNKPFLGISPQNLQTFANGWRKKGKSG